MEINYTLHKKIVLQVVQFHHVTFVDYKITLFLNHFFFDLVDILIQIDMFYFSFFI